MSACEKCWTDSRIGDNYGQLVASRSAAPCTPEEQAGPEAKNCPDCYMPVLHQHTGEHMGVCEPKQSVDG